jgi:HK97 gp10 family phage protein
MMNLKFDGVAEVQAFLNEYAPKEAIKLLNNTMRAVAVEYKKEAQRRAPTHRTLNLKKSLKVKKRKSPRHEPKYSVVFEHGLKAKHDGFYWRFVEHGTLGRSGHPFLQPAIDAMIPKTDNLVGEMFTKKLAAKYKKNLKIMTRARSGL